jgi:hypothetical protein
MLLSMLFLSTLRFYEQEPEIYKTTDRVMYFLDLMHTIFVTNITTLITSDITIYIIKMDKVFCDHYFDI